MKKLISYYSSIILHALFLCILILFYGCNKVEETQSSQLISIEKKEPVKSVRFIGQWLNEGKRETLLRDFVREYEFEHQEVIIDLQFPEEVFLTGENAMSNQSFVAKIIAEPVPEWDIIRLNNQFQEVVAITGDSLWAKKNLVDFSDYPEFRNNTLPSLLSEEMKAKWGGIIPGPYIEGQYWALWSNIEVANKVGVVVKQYGMTTTDLLAYIKAVNAYNESHPDDYIVPIHDGTDWGTLFVMVFQIYLSELNDNGLLYSITADERKLLAWENVLLLLEELSKLKASDQTTDEISWYKCGMDLLDGKALFYVNGSWMYNIFEKADPIKTKNCVPNEFPINNEVSTYPGSYLCMWGVLKNSPNRDEAINLLLAMNTPDVGDRWVQFTKSPTGIRTTFSDGMAVSDQFEKFAHHIQMKYGDQLYHYSEQMNKYILGPNFWLPNYFKDVFEGDLSAEEAMARIRSELILN